MLLFVAYVTLNTAIALIALMAYPLYLYCNIAQRDAKVR